MKDKLTNKKMILTFCKKSLFTLFLNKVKFIIICC